MKKTAAFLSLGCKVNSYETEAMRGMFEAAGYEIVDFKDQADVYVINTCTVTNIADRKSRQMLHQAKKRNPQAVIAAVGCYVQAAEEALLEDSAVDIVVGNNKKSDIVELVTRFQENRNKEDLVVDINEEVEYEELNVISTMEKTRAFIKIQDGCNRFCSYCIIPYVRGRVRSRSEEDILSEIRALVDKGYQEFVFTGIHISSYGTDLLSSQELENGRMPLAELIVEIGEIAGIERIRLGSLEPRIITEKFVEMISSVKQFCPHFHLSLQSGSDSVLKRMNRKYSAKEYEERVNLLRKFFEHPAFTTDVIVGFPGESEEEFQETLEFVKGIGFSQIHVFKYSKRAGTVAAKMPNQIPEDIKHQRSNELITLVERMAKEYKDYFMGRIEKILIEEEINLGGKTYQIGHNERYLKLAVECDEDLTNRVIEAKVCNNLTDEILLCEIIH
ncbi:MAG TPA: tRNA (N(6)-L-threonylcarbamoyladenosine(37)-C(2))-methylthiotransferase MtaB [Clostridiales bacterium]|nr:tRNA (N(6)-L-threonylcarbamoyladenosine(37)-C(2))-methylthiotransferase MtaB [Clostridiales bacterium]